jgi:glycosyltransferase involved in cell wall biosynthesis
MNAADRSVSNDITMIVKNESKTILRLLESLDGFIDEFYYDTGSTDDTVEIIRTYAKPKNQRTHNARTVQNFGYNRNVVLNFANLNSRSSICC